MQLHTEDAISFAGYRHLDIRHDSAWIMSCVLYAHSAICLFTIMAFASYGLVWPVKETDTMLHKTTRKGTRYRVSMLYGNEQFNWNLQFINESVRSTVAAKPVMIVFVTSRSGTFPVFSTFNGVKRCRNGVDQKDYHGVWHRNKD